MKTELTDEIYVGQGLKVHTYQDALAFRINPNPNGEGKFRENLEDTESMKTWIDADLDDAIDAVKASCA